MQTPTAFPRRNALLVMVAAALLGGTFWPLMCEATGAFGETDAMHDAVLTTALISGAAGGILGAVFAMAVLGRRRAQANALVGSQPDLQDPIPSLPALAPYICSLMSRDSLERVLVAMAIAADEAGFYFVRRLGADRGDVMPADALTCIGAKVLEAQLATGAERLPEAELRFQLGAAVRRGEAAIACSNLLAALAGLDVVPVRFADHGQGIVTGVAAPRHEAGASGSAASRLAPVKVAQPVQGEAAAVQ